MPLRRQDTAANVAEEAGLLAPSLIHEMRQPLTGLRAGLELLSRRLGPTLTGSEEWGIVTAQVERLDELLRAYQDFLHPERNPPETFAVRPVVERAVALQIFRLRKLGPRFSFEPGEPLSGFGLPAGLLHAAANVLVNALDALEASGKEGRLAVRVLPGAIGSVEVRVSDEGPGVPANLREKIFEARFSTKAHGTGLGLAISRRMMAAFGGRVELAPDKDARRLPWAKTEFVLVVPPPPASTAGGRR